MCRRTCATVKSASSNSESVPKGSVTQLPAPRSALSEAMAFERWWPLARSRSSATSALTTVGGSRDGNVLIFGRYRLGVERLRESGRRGLGHRRRARQDAGDPLVGHRDVEPDLRRAPRFGGGPLLGRLGRQFPQLADEGVVAFWNRARIVAARSADMGLPVAEFQISDLRFQIGVDRPQILDPTPLNGSCQSVNLKSEFLNPVVAVRSWNITSPSMISSRARSRFSTSKSSSASSRGRRRRRKSCGGSTAARI